MKFLPLFLVALGLMDPGYVHATEAGPGHNQASMRHEEGFIVRKGIRDDYTVVFHIMRSPKGMRYSKEQYHLMVVVEKEGRPITGLHMISRVKHPDGSVERKSMMHMGEWYMALYNLSHDTGRHWITVEFEVGGEKYLAGTYYPEMDFSGESR